MAKIRLALVTLVIIMLSASSLFPEKAQAQKKIYIGGSMAITGAYAENVAAVLAAFQDHLCAVSPLQLHLAAAHFLPLQANW